MTFCAFPSVLEEIACILQLPNIPDPFITLWHVWTPVSREILLPVPDNQPGFVNHAPNHCLPSCLASTVSTQLLISHLHLFRQADDWHLAHVGLIIWVHPFRWTLDITNAHQIMGINCLFTKQNPPYMDSVLAMGLRESWMDFCCVAWVDFWYYGLLGLSYILV